jgi:hypothetical protein
MPAKTIPQTKIDSDSRWLSEDETVAFILQQLKAKELRLNLSIIDLLKANRRNPQYRTVLNSSGITDIPTCGNRSQYGHCSFYHSTFRNRIHYWQPDVTRWLESSIFPKCKSIREVA